MARNSGFALTPAKIGWILSGALLAAIVGYVVVTQLSASSVSEPTWLTTRGDFMELKQVEVSPAAIFGSVPTQAGNAADDYKQAVDLYKANEPKIKAALGQLTQIAGGTPAKLETMNVVEKIYALVSAGTAKTSMRYSFVCSPKEFAIRSTYDPATDLSDVADALRILMTQQQALKHYPEEEQTLRTLFFLGWHMANEKSRMMMVVGGLDCQDDSLAELASLYAAWEPQKHTAQIVAMKKYQDALKVVQDAYQAKGRVVWNAKVSPGDLFNLVAHDADPVWRVEALLRMGVVKFMDSDKPADVKQAEKMIQERLSSHDEYECAAAKAAAAAVVEDVQKMAS